MLLGLEKFVSRMRSHLVCFLCEPVQILKVDGEFAQVERKVLTLGRQMRQPPVLVVHQLYVFLAIRRIQADAYFLGKKTLVDLIR